MLNSLFYYHGNPSAISVVRTFKNKTRLRKPSSIQKTSPNMEHGNQLETRVKLQYTTPTHLKKLFIEA